jgi:starvation-inducible DNA-binding protein
MGDKSTWDRRITRLNAPTDLGTEAARDVAAALNSLLADMFVLYVKTRNFHWHISGPHFRDYYRLLDEQAAQIHAATDAIAERVRRIGRSTLHSIGHISRLQRLADNDADYVRPLDMLAELREDNLLLAAHMHEAYAICEQHGDVASASLLGTWIDEAERRIWYLFETSRPNDAAGP